MHAEELRTHAQRACVRGDVACSTRADERDPSSGEEGSLLARTSAEVIYRRASRPTGRLVRL